MYIFTKFVLTSFPRHVGTVELKCTVQPFEQWFLRQSSALLIEKN
jgi:hypothetical protein